MDIEKNTDRTIHETNRIETKRIKNLAIENRKLNLGEILKNARLEKGLSQIILANKLGVNSSSISRWEKNQQIIAGDTLVEVAKILNITNKLFPHFQKDISQKNVVVENLAKKVMAIEKKINNNNQSKKLQIIISASDYNSQISIQEAILQLPKKYNVVNIYNNEEMHNFLNSGAFCVTLAIISVSEKNGLEVLKTLEEKMGSIPKILILDENVKVENFMGITASIKKPFTPNNFLRLLQKINLDWPILEMP